jgi:lipid-binding SYLF domain-containing protein
MRCGIMVTMAAVALAVGLLGGCSTEPKNEKDVAVLSANSKAAFDSFKAKDPSLQPLLDKAVGYVVFPDIGKAAWVVGGSFGRGEVYEGGKQIGYAKVTSASFGLQGGAQTVAELLIFMRQADLDGLKKGEFSLGANASAVVLTAGAAAKTDPAKSVIAIVDPKGGLMAEASVSGQVIRFEALK